MAGRSVRPGALSLTGRRACVYLKGMRVCLFFFPCVCCSLRPGPSGGAGPAGTLSVLSACGVAHAAQTSRKQPQKRRAKKKKASLHASPGPSGSPPPVRMRSGKMAWKGRPCTIVPRAAVRKLRPWAIPPASRPPSGGRRNVRKKDEERRRRGGLGMSLDTDDSVWRPQTPAAPGKPDEILSIGNSRHTLRAFGDVRSDDLSISVGRRSRSRTRSTAAILPAARNRIPPWAWACASPWISEARAARLKPSGKTAFFLRNVRPYGLKRETFQPKNTLGRVDTDFTNNFSG